MFLIRVRHVALLLVVSLAATLGSGIWAYKTAGLAGLKGPAETVLFLCLCAAGLELLLGIALFREGRRKRRELDSIADAVKYGGVLPYDRLERFGSLGEQIRFLLKDLSESGERKSERIASLTVLLRNVLALVDAPVLIVAPDGRVLEASKGAREDARFKDIETGRTRIEDLAPEIHIRAVLQEADKTHSAVELPGHISFHPIYSEGGQMGYFLADFSHAGIRKFLSGLGQTEKRPSAEKEKKKSAFLERLRGRVSKNEAKEPKK